MDWGAFAGGLSKTWDSAAIGGALRQGVADYKYDKAKEEATKKRDSELEKIKADTKDGQEVRALNGGKPLDPSAKSELYQIPIPTSQDATPYTASPAEQAVAQGAGQEPSSLMVSSPQPSALAAGLPVPAGASAAGLPTSPGGATPNLPMPSGASGALPDLGAKTPASALYALPETKVAQDNSAAAASRISAGELARREAMAHADYAASMRDARAERYRALGNYEKADALEDDNQRLAEDGMFADMVKKASAGDKDTLQQLLSYSNMVNKTNYQLSEDGKSVFTVGADGNRVAQPITPELISSSVEGMYNSWKFMNKMMGMKEFSAAQKALEDRAISREGHNLKYDELTETKRHNAVTEQNYDARTAAYLAGKLTGKGKKEPELWYGKPDENGMVLIRMGDENGPIVGQQNSQTGNVVPIGSTVEKEAANLAEAQKHGLTYGFVRRFGRNVYIAPDGRVAFSIDELVPDRASALPKGSGNKKATQPATKKPTSKEIDEAASKTRSRALEKIKEGGVIQTNFVRSVLDARERQRREYEKEGRGLDPELQEIIDSERGVDW